nr:hypothetical protein [Tanacetum cinerariifolium]
MFKLDLVPLAPKLLQNREAHINYLKYTQEQADILQGIVEQAKAKQPLDNPLDFACKHARRIQELPVYVRDTCPNAINLSAKKVAIRPKNNVKKVSRAKSTKKHKKQNIWKPMGYVFTEVGFKWKPTSRTFTIVSTSCPLTRVTSANVVPRKKTTSYSVETQKPELKVYNRKPKNVKNVGSSKKAKIVESKNTNHSEPNHTWGSNATDIPSSSSLVMTHCPYCSLVSGLWMFETYDREPLSAHEILQEAVAPRAMVLADSHVSTSIEQDALSISIISTQDQEHSLIISQGFEESPKATHFHDDQLHEDSTSQGSSSNVRPIHSLFKHLGRWTKDHPIANMIGDPSRFVSTRNQL